MATAPNAQQAKNESVRQTIRSTADSLIGQYFSGTLGQYQDMLNVFMSMTYYESRWNVNAVGPTVYGYDYRNSSAILKLYQPNQGSAEQRKNVVHGLQALGLTQSMGWNVVKGGSLKDGKCLVEAFRPDLIGMLCVEPGDNLYAKFLGEDNIVNNLMLGLVVLESKWKSCKPSGSGWTLGGIYFNSRIQASVSGYLGLSPNGDANGTKYTSYTRSILGSFYVAANGVSAPMVSDSKTQYAKNTASGPILAGNTNSARVSGCTAAKA